MLENKLDASEQSVDPIDSDREIMCFLQERYPDVIFGQLKCSSEDYACEKCPPGRVVACSVLSCEAGLRKQVQDELVLEQKQRDSS